MDAILRDHLSRAHSAALDVPPGKRGPTERAVIALWMALLEANLGRTFEANEHAKQVVAEIQALNKQVQIEAEKERVR